MTKIMSRVGMKEHPIIFSADMVKAILEGRKTQTRRIIKKPLVDSIYGCATFDMNEVIASCPYGQVGDKLWVRESWGKRIWRDVPTGFNWNVPPNSRNEKGILGNYELASVYKEQYGNLPLRVKWKSPIFMPRWASRITLEITNIQVERLREISEKDCLEEGIKTVGLNCRTCNGSGWNYTYPLGCPDCKKTGTYNKPYFKDLWNSLAKNGFEWGSNPWVWVISFKKIKFNTPPSQAAKKEVK